MGTRSLTLVYDGNSTVGDDAVVLNMYAQWDGYPSSHGYELAKFLKGRKMVNGYTFADQGSQKLSNGMTCLAASLVVNFKDSVGGFYLHPLTMRDLGQDYEYHIYRDAVKIKDWDGKTIFEGDWSEFYDFTVEAKECRTI